ncbi:MAG: glycoside hydrolase family 2 protein [Steroidobacteraceae bacterium]
MTGPIRRFSSHQRQALIDGWECAAAAPADTADPQGLSARALTWTSAQVPGTAASSLQAIGEWATEAPARNFDGEDWWYRLQFSAEPALPGERVILGFEGLATLAEVWLNGTLLFESMNMFIEHQREVGALLERNNHLLIRCRSLAKALEVRRPRPRWKTPMVQHQQLRWIRTTLLGRTPGWSPPAPPVGPWRPVWLERRRLSVDNVRLQATVQPSGDAPPVGRLSLAAELSLHDDAVLQAAQLVIERDGQRYEAALDIRSPPFIRGTLDIAGVSLWWPHTHGEPCLYRAQLRLLVQAPGGAAGHTIVADLGRVGFRELHLRRNGGDFALSVNGQSIFCRGACWTPIDCISLNASRADYEQALGTVRAAGMNMLRVAGPLVYESDEFLDLCDSLGILLWQDFMFANMDYPAGDAVFRATADREVRQQLTRLQGRPALAVLCGNSEVAQQAAMCGAPPECWSPVFFESDLAALSREYCPDVPYSPSSAHGGAFPHQADVGCTSYYGVGAYRLPMTDARRADLRFASECLALANVPAAETLESMTQGQPLRCHHPRWKDRVPRDQGAGWDFDDVRDHYVAELFGVDTLPLRYADHDRYLQLGRAACGEVMAACFSEWRRPRSRCRGALVWFLRDLWPGAGWGVIDSTGLPKSAYYYLKRVLQPVGLFISNEGTNGLMIHIVNESGDRVASRLELRLFRQSEPIGAIAARDLALHGASSMELPATDFFDGFVDLSYAYRFGPAPYDMLHARLLRADDASLLTDAFYFPLGLPNARDAQVGLSAIAQARGDGSYTVLIQCARFAQSVHMDFPGYVADDQFFHMAPESSRSVHLRLRDGHEATPLAGTVRALNTDACCTIALAP